MPTYRPWLLFEMEVSEQITGLLAEFPNLMEATFWQLGNHIRSIARRLAPFKTGALQTAISLTTTKRSDHAIRVAGGKRLRPEARFAGVTRPPEDAIDIHAAAGYATFQEYGTVRNPAHPFLYPAAIEAQRRFAPIFSQEFINQLRGVYVRTYKV